MSGFCALVGMCMLLMGPHYLSGAEEMTASEKHKGERLVRGRRSVPYWNLWASDFHGWVEELRAQAGYDTLKDLAHSYWAHFPIASYLGYDSPSEPQDPDSE